jgi:hypothetical protein
MAKTTVYSLADVRTVMYHQDVGQCVLSSQGVGKISVTYAGDLSSHTATADGFVVVNRLRNSHGIVTIEVPQNSSADEYLRRWSRYLRNTQSYLFALTALNIVDQMGGFTIYCEGVTPQKIPDRTYDQTAGNVSWVLLAASITEG